MLAIKAKTLALFFLLIALLFPTRLSSAADLPEGLEGNSGEPDYAYSYEGAGSTLIFYTHGDGTIYEVRLMEDLF